MNDDEGCKFISRGVRHALLLCFVGGSLLLSSCADLGYYVQCATGHLGVMSKCEPIPKLLDDPHTSPALKGQLETVLAIRDFASGELGLPDNGSYRSYGDLGRPYVLWNVVATPEFSLEPIQWCFPVAGCVSYRGYYKRDAAQQFAERLQRQGHDVYLYGVPAYSTLNWFDDPVLNTFIGRSEPYLAGMIFHELAHQQVYVKGDSAFNEAFATTVEMEGVRRWLEYTGDSGALSEYRTHFDRGEAVRGMLAEVRRQLSELYAESLPDEEKRLQKEKIFAEARARYADLKSNWEGYRGYDGWIAGLNNARLGSMSTYHDLVPALQNLLAQEGGSLPLFFRSAAELGRLPIVERTARLEYSTEQVAQAPEDSVEEGQEG